MNVKDFGEILKKEIEESAEDGLSGDEIEAGINYGLRRAYELWEEFIKQDK